MSMQWCSPLSTKVDLPLVRQLLLLQTVPVPFHQVTPGGLWVEDRHDTWKRVGRFRFWNVFGLLSAHSFWKYIFKYFRLFQRSGWVLFVGKYLFRFNQCGSQGKCWKRFCNFNPSNGEEFIVYKCAQHEYKLSLILTERERKRELRGERERERERRERERGEKEREQVNEALFQHTINDKKIPLKSNYNTFLYIEPICL